MADFLSYLQGFESGDHRHPERGGSNIANTHEGTTSGQAQGYNQITTGTWKEFGGLQYAPTPLQATQEQQNAIAMKIPMRRWAPETLQFLSHSGFTVDPNRTLAGNIALNGGAAAGGPAMGTTLNSTPPGIMDPSIVARGGVSSPGSSAPSIAAAPTPTLGDNIKKGDVGAALAQLTANKTDENGKEKPSVLDKLAGVVKSKEQQQPSGGGASAPMLPQDSTPMIAPAAQQLLASTFANSAKPLSWSTTPFGSGVAGPIGTTLNGVPSNVYG